MTTTGTRSPLLSVGLPVFNAASTLPLAISSIVAQTFRDWELLILDDGSSDSSVAVANGFRDSRIRVISDGRHAGLSERLNQAVALSRGRYFARMDADDCSYPERFERQLGFLQHNREVDLVGCQ